MSDLLPCPFCGGEARVWQDPSHSKAFFIGCDDGETDCFGATQWAKTEPEAIAAWNHREIPAAQPSPDVAALVALMPEVIASLDTTNCNISLVRELRAALARVKGGEA